MIVALLSHLGNIMIKRSLRLQLFFLCLLLAPLQANSIKDITSSLGQIIHRGVGKVGAVTEDSSYQKVEVTNASSSVANLVEVYEHEFFDSENQLWIGGCGHNSTQRWTSSPSGKRHRLPPPSQLKAPEGYEYTSEWKIDVTGSSNIRDKLGWEYFIDGDKGSGRRRRRWLRSVVSMHHLRTSDHFQNATRTFLTQNKTSTFEFWAVSKREMLLVKNYINDKIWKEVIDAFNFKGYGFAIQKSMLSRNACAIILRLPLTVHFDFFETRPWLPLLTSTFAIYFPFSGSLSINASLPVAIFKFAILTILDQLKFLLTVAWYIITKVIILDIVGTIILSNIFKILGFGETETTDCSDDKYNAEGEIKKEERRKLRILDSKRPTVPIQRELKYSSRISERIGFSLTWQYHRSKGMEFKFGWWHCLLPTIDYIDEVCTKIINQSTQRSQRAKTNFAEAKDWLRQKVGSFGIILGQQTTPSQSFSCSAALSLSGFYYGGNSLKMLYSLIHNQHRSKTEKAKNASQTRTLWREKNVKQSLNANEDSHDEEIIQMKVAVS